MSNDFKKVDKGHMLSMGSPTCNLKVVLITGAASGIGRECAILLAKKGFVIFAGVRNKNDLEKYDKTNHNIVPILLDVTNERHINNAYKKILSYTKSEGLFGIVNNAGIALSGPLEILPMKEIENQFDVNVFGCLRIIQKFLPLIRQRHGCIINIGSISGRIAGPFLGPYAASKFAIRAITDALRLELKMWGIPVILVEPGRIATPIWQKTIKYSRVVLNTLKNSFKNKYVSILKRVNENRIKGGSKGMDPYEVAKVIYGILESKSPRSRYLVGLDAKIINLIIKLFPDEIINYLISRKVDS